MAGLIYVGVIRPICLLLHFLCSFRCFQVLKHESDGNLQKISTHRGDTVLSSEEVRFNLAESSEDESDDDNKSSHNRSTVDSNVAKWLKLWVLASIFHVISEYIYTDFVLLEFVVLLGVLLPLDASMKVWAVNEKIYSLCMQPLFASVDKHVIVYFVSVYGRISTALSRMIRGFHKVSIEWGIEGMDVPELMELEEYLVSIRGVLTRERKRRQVDEFKRYQAEIETSGERKTSSPGDSIVDSVGIRRRKNGGGSASSRRPSRHSIGGWRFNGFSR